MSIDAQHWVWNHSRTRGNSRLVLLAVADAVRTPDCTVRMGMTELQRRLGGVPKSTVVAAVDKALSTDELAVAEAAAGSRATLYRLPFAVGYTRPAPGTTGSDSRPVADSGRSGFPTATESDRSEIPTGRHMPSGRESLPGGTEKPTASGRESLPLYQSSFTRRASKQESPAAAPDLGPGIPANSRPLVDAITAAGVVVRWNLSAAEWFTVEALIQRSGVAALADYARRQAAARDISYARYFLGGWRDLPPLPAAGTVPPGVIDLTTARPAGRAARAADLYRAALGGDPS